MDEKNEFALVRRPPSAVEKTELGAKRVLSGMVADTLALASKRPPGKPVLTVLLGGHLELTGIWAEMLQSLLGNQYSLKTISTDKAVEVIALAERHLFDFFIIGVNAMSPVGLYEIRSEASDGAPWDERMLRLVAQMKSQYGKPILAMSGWGAEHIEKIKNAGADVHVELPFKFEEFQTALRRCAIIPPDQIA